MTNKSLVLSCLLCHPSKSCPCPRSLSPLCLWPCCPTGAPGEMVFCATSSPCFIGILICPAVALFAPCSELCAAAWQLCQAGSCWAGAREHLSSDRSCWASSASRGCSLPCPPRVLVPPAACVHKDDLSLCEQQSSQLSQECDPGCCAAGSSHGLGPCQPAAASPKPGTLGGSVPSRL